MVPGGQLSRRNLLGLKGMYLRGSYFIVLELPVELAFNVPARREIRGIRLLSHHLQLLSVLAINLFI